MILLSYLVGLHLCGVLPHPPQPHTDHQGQVLRLPQMPVSDVVYVAIVLHLDGLRMLLLNRSSSLAS